MKILLVTQYFYPENFKSNDIAFELQKRGHDITVLTGLPNYPQGKFYGGYGVFKNRKEVIQDVKIIRSLLIPRGKSGPVRLFLNYMSWPFFASIRALGLLNKKYDAIIVHQTSPVMQAIPAIFLHKLTKVPVYLWVLDLWPESLGSAGNISNKYVLSFFNSLTRYIYKNSHKILMSSRGFKKSILKKGDFEDKLIYFPNWVENEIIEGDINYQLPELPEGFKVMFAGNIGVAQDMPSILKAAQLLKNQKDIKFVIVGDGRYKPQAEEFIRENSLEDTVFMMGKYPLEAMAAFFNRADALLVSLKDEEIFNLTVPSKVQVYLASGKPILTMLNGEGSEIVREAEGGYCADAGDYRQLAENIKQLYSLSPASRALLGENAFDYYKKNFKLEDCMDNLEDILTK